MDFSMEMTIEQLVDEMNNGGSQSELYKVSKINKDVLPYLFRVAGYTREKQKYITTDEVRPQLSIAELLPEAKELHKQVKLEKLSKSVSQKPAVIEAAPQVVETNVGANLIEQNKQQLIDFSDRAQMQHAILDVLELTADDLAAIRALKDVTINQTSESIYDAINKLGSRKRANKTYYLSEDIVAEVAEFTASKTLKTSQFVEIALLEAMQKYR